MLSSINENTFSILPIILNDKVDNETNESILEPSCFFYLKKRSGIKWFNPHKNKLLNELKKNSTPIYQFDVSSGVITERSDDSEIILFPEIKYSFERSEIHYVQRVCDLPNVEIVVYEELPEFKYIATILSERDIETSEKIYEVEMKISEFYPNETFYFSVDWINENSDFNSMIKDKKIIFRKSIIYAE